MKNYKKNKKRGKEYYLNRFRNENPTIDNSIIDKYNISNSEVYKYATLKGYKRIRKQINSIRKYYYIKDK